MPPKTDQTDPVEEVEAPAPVDPANDAQGAPPHHIDPRGETGVREQGVTIGSRVTNEGEAGRILDLGDGELYEVDADGLVCAVLSTPAPAPAADPAPEV